MQCVFFYDYGQEKHAVKQAKKLRGQSVYVWVIQHPVTGRYKVIEGDSIEDRPSRVPVLWEHYNKPAPAPSQRMMDRDNLIWLANLEHQNEGAAALATAILEYLENYDA